MTQIRKCTQTKCCYNKNSQYANGCPRCAECSCAPHSIDEDCTECWNCERDEGKIRSGQPDTTTETQKEAEKEKEIIIEH